MMKHLILVVLFSGLNVFASAKKPIATIILAGDSVVTHDNGKGKSEPGTTGFKLVENDVVTVTSSPAKIVMYKERVVIKVAPNSSVKIVQGDSDDKPVIDGRIFLNSGKVKTEVNGKDKSKDRFEVHTGNGTLGVRGTVFFVTYDEANQVTEEYTMQGKVRANARDGHTITGGSGFRSGFSRKQVDVEAGFMVRIVKDKEVSDPIPFIGEDGKKLDDEFEGKGPGAKGQGAPNKGINKSK